MSAKPKFKFEDEPTLTIEHVDDNEVDRVAQSFAGQTLFITGGTGFLGKVLIEKLLRSCGELRKIYLLIRPKKGKTPQERIKDIFNNVLFDTVKQQRGVEQILSQVAVIHGDIMMPGCLGICDEDLETLRNEVNIVYHCAATVRFDEPLRRAVFMNTRGTMYMLDLAAKLKHLRLFAYVSTSYCHLDVKTLYEQSYDPPADPHRVIKACEWLSDEEVNMIEKKILGDIPNTYAYTKSLAEALVVEKFNEMPTVILRPSIVIPIWKEPLPGWTDNINGPTGLLIGAGKGVIRTMYCKSSGYGDFLPVDVAVNGIIVASWRWLTNGVDGSNRIAHMTSSNDIKVSWAEIIELGRWVIENKVPLNGVAWYPGGSMKSNYFVHYICMILFHWLPAIFVDALLLLLRYPPVLCRVQNRITKGFQVFEYYANNVWNFDNAEAIKLRKLLNNKERLTYVIEKIDLDLVDYFTQCVLCARRLILKESDESIPAARRHMKIMWCVDKLFKALCIFGFCYLIYKHFLAGFITSTTLVQPLQQAP